MRTLLPTLRLGYAATCTSYLAVQRALLLAYCCPVLEAAACCCSGRQLLVEDWMHAAHAWMQAVVLCRQQGDADGVHGTCKIACSSERKGTPASGQSAAAPSGQLSPSGPPPPPRLPPAAAASGRSSSRRAFPGPSSVHKGTSCPSAG
jgi:hypothetical protein